MWDKMFPLTIDSNGLQIIEVRLNWPVISWVALITFLDDITYLSLPPVIWY